MADDVIHLEGEPARALAALLQQALTEGVAAMSETRDQLMAAIRANTDVTASLRQGFESFRTQQQAKLDEALARVESEVAARVQAETDRDAIRAAIEEARTAIEADTAQETELLSAVTANTPAAPQQPALETPAEPPVAVEPPPVEQPAPVDVAPVVETPVETAPVTQGEPAPVVTPAPDGTTPATNGIGESFNADGTPVAPTNG